MDNKAKRDINKKLKKVYKEYKLGKKFLNKDECIEMIECSIIPLRDYVQNQYGDEAVEYMYTTLYDYLESI